MSFFHCFVVFVVSGLGLDFAVGFFEEIHAEDRIVGEGLLRGEESGFAHAIPQPRSSLASWGIDRFVVENMKTRAAFGLAFSGFRKPPVEAEGERVTDLVHPWFLGQKRKDFRVVLFVLTEATGFKKSLDESLEIGGATLGKVVGDGEDLFRMSVREFN